MRKHPKSKQLGRNLNRALAFASAFSTEAFRAASVEYANRDDLLTGLGAKVNGGRWNPPRSFATVYTSLSAETAVSEYLAHQRHFGFRDSDALPCALVGLDVNLQKVLDLTSSDIREALGVSEAQMLDGAWRAAMRHESLTQAIGRLAFDAGLEGLVVPSSAAPATANLLVFPGNIVTPGGYVQIVNRDKLPSPRSPEK